MNRASKLVCALTATVALAACGSTTASSTPSHRGKTLKLGAVFSLTGLAAEGGKASSNGILLAQDTVNQAGGLNGTTISFEIRDDASDAGKAKQHTEELIKAGQVMALLGPTLSNSAVAAHPMAESLRTPMMGTSNTGLNIVGTCPYPCTFIFRDSLGEATAIPTNIKAYADQARPRTAVLLYPNDDKFSADGAQIVKDSVGKSGIQLLDSVEFSKTTTDLTPFVARAARKNPDVMIMTSLAAASGKLMKSARQQGFKGQFLGGNGFNSAASVTQAGEAGKGARSGSAWYSGIDTKTNKEFTKTYRERYKTNPDQLAAQAYTAVLILADAAKRAGLSFSDLVGDRKKLRDALESTNLPDTPLGAFQFTKDHDVKQTVYIVEMDGTSGHKLVTTVKP